MHTKVFTRYTTLRTVKREPLFAGFRDFIAIPDDKWSWLVDRIPMDLVPRWNGRSIADGFNRLREICLSGTRAFYPLRSPEECAATPALAENGMLHFPGKKGAPFVVICPGGGYEVVCSMFEGFPVASALNRMGYHAFVVQYRYGRNALHPNPQDDLAQAVRYILDHAETLGVCPDNYAVAGFSAGGHLAGSFGTKSLGWKHDHLPKPAAIFLSYPVVTMGEYTHPQTRHNLLGDRDQDPALRDQWSLEKQMDEDSPPVFLWQCEADAVVPIQNSRMLRDRLRACGVPCAYREYPGKAHGWGLAQGEAAEGWLDLAVTFWQEQCKR